MFPRMKVKHRPIKSLACVIYRLTWLGLQGARGETYGGNAKSGRNV